MTIEAPRETILKWRALTERLIYGTQSGRLDWDDGPFDNSIMTSIKDIVVTLRKIERDYWITITDQFGSVVDMFSDVNLSTINGENAYTEMDNLFKAVKRKINGADEILDSLLIELPEVPDEIPF